MLVNLVQRHTVEELVAELKARKTISKEQVLRESTLQLALPCKGQETLTVLSEKQG